LPGFCPAVAEDVLVRAYCAVVSNTSYVAWSNSTMRTVVIVGVFRRLGNCGQRDLGGGCDGPAIDSGGYRGERDTVRLEIDGDSHEFDEFHVRIRDAHGALDSRQKSALVLAGEAVDGHRGAALTLLGLLAKSAELADPVSVAIPGAGLVIDDTVTVVNHLESPSAIFNGPPEAFVRLISGRLKAPYDNGVTIDGSITLDDLRRVFPGF
jgi:hypothetical protein